MLSALTCDENIVTSVGKYCDKPENLGLLWKPFPFIVLSEVSLAGGAAAGWPVFLIMAHFWPCHSAVGQIWVSI